MMNNRVWISETMKLSALRERVFPLLCPVREFEWIDGWDCRLIHSVSGVAELDCVFETNFRGAPEVWTTVLYDPPRAISYLVVEPQMVHRLSVELEPVGSGTQLKWMDIYTARTDDAVGALAARVAERKQVIWGLERMLQHFLACGSKLKRSELHGRVEEHASR